VLKQPDKEQYWRNIVLSSDINW